MLFHAQLEHLFVPGVKMSVGIAEPDGEKAQQTAISLYPNYRVVMLSEVKNVTELNRIHLRITSGVENIGVEGSQREMYSVTKAAVQASPEPFTPIKAPSRTKEPASHDTVDPAVPTS